MEKPMLDFVKDGLNACKGEWNDIADASGVPYSTLCKIAQGHTEDPRISSVQALFDYLTHRAAA